ncbi:MAG: hypothetical protein ACOCTT_04310 [archaeon]
MIDTMYASRYRDTYRGKEQLTLKTRSDGRKIIVSQKEEDNR